MTCHSQSPFSFATRTQLGREDEARKLITRFLFPMTEQTANTNGEQAIYRCLENLTGCRSVQIIKGSVAKLSAAKGYSGELVGCQLMVKRV